MSTEPTPPNKVSQPVPIKNSSFNYSVLFGLKFALNPYHLLKYIESLEIICSRCKGTKKIKFRDDSIRVQCKCGCGILYPPRIDRANAHLYRWVSAQEFEKNGGGYKEKKGEHDGNQNR